MSPAERSASLSRAFTIVELLITVAIVGILLALIVPSMGNARENARMLKCAVNTRSLAQSIAVYANEYHDRLPPAYVAADPLNETPTWLFRQHGDTDSEPYIHWTRMVTGDLGAVDVQVDAFKCPSSPDGGAPARRSAPEATEVWQQRYYGRGDWQPPRMAYTVNGALMPPGTMMNHWRRQSRLVNLSEINHTERVILTTEFYNDPTVGWRSIGELNLYSRSYRPIMPFIAGSMGAFDVYDEPSLGNEPRFFYPDNNSVFTSSQLRSIQFLFGTVDLLTSNAITSINAVGRRHPQRTLRDGGLANFAFLDGHVERMHPRTSLEQELWGDRFWSITGNSTVAVRQRLQP